MRSARDPIVTPPRKLIPTDVELSVRVVRSGFTVFESKIVFPMQGGGISWREAAQKWVEMMETALMETAIGLTKS